MKLLNDFSMVESHQVVSIKEQIETRQRRLKSYRGKAANGLPNKPLRPGPHRMSISTSRITRLAQRAHRAKKNAVENAPDLIKRRPLSAAGRARIAAAANGEDAGESQGGVMHKSPGRFLRQCDALAVGCLFIFSKL
jgi:hypothetical protein